MAEDWLQTQRALVLRLRALADEFDAITESARALGSNLCPCGKPIGHTEFCYGPVCNCTCPIAGAHDPDCAVYGPPLEPPSAEVLFVRHEECEASDCAVCSACGLHVLDNPDDYACRRHGYLIMPSSVTLSPDQVEAFRAGLRQIVAKSEAIAGSAAGSDLDANGSHVG